MNREAILVIVLVLVLAAVFGMLNGRGTTGQTTGGEMETENTKILLETTKGNIVIELYSDMPVTTGNFEKLVGEGFYDGILFHRVIEGFMLQAGDPLTKDSSKQSVWGTGGPGYQIKDEFTHEGGNKNSRGTISMANAGPNTGGSQFFINLVDNNFLDTKHPVFGEVVEGMDVVDEIGAVQTGFQDRPVEEVKIIRASVI